MRTAERWWWQPTGVISRKVPANESNDRRLKITATVFSVVIVVAMLGVRTCMKHREKAESDVPVAPTVSAIPSNGKSCSITSEPAGAVAYALLGDGKTALGITPLDVDQGEYDVVLELDGHMPHKLRIGLHDGPCALSTKLVAR